MVTETIAAIATAISNSGIGIIRVSGSQSLEIVNKIYCNKKYEKCLLLYKSHTIHYGYIVEKEELIDEVMVTVLLSPKSYTMEDTVEINCHGGILIMNKILDLVLKNGARIAQPGEFTKRAFLNGRIDLSKAEAVMDMIQAKNEFAMKASLNQLKGSVTNKVVFLRNEVLYQIAFIESALDDPEHISLEGYKDQLLEKMNQLLIELNSLLATANNGIILKEGINTVIVGKPNAGKSSLLNILIGKERAIVTDVAGTTRDILEESILINGISLNIIDTAGIRDTSDIVEQIGVGKAKKYAENADLILFVLDSSSKIDINDQAIFQMIENKKVIILLNKSDLNSVITEREIRQEINKQKIIQNEKDLIIIRTSTKDNSGIIDLEQAILNLFFNGKITYNNEIFITNTRHKEALKETCESLIMVKKSIEEDMPEDFYSIDLMSAYSSLGSIIGEEVGEDLVNEIFSKFCMGK